MVYTEQCDMNMIMKAHMFACVDRKLKLKQKGNKIKRER